VVSNTGQFNFEQAGDFSRIKMRTSSGGRASESAPACAWVWCAAGRARAAGVGPRRPPPECTARVALPSAMADPQRLRDFSSRVRQRYATGIVALQPASFRSERHGPIGGTIQPPDGSPLHRIPGGRLMKQAYQRKCHRFGLVGHQCPGAWVEGHAAGMKRSYRVQVSDGRAYRPTTREAVRFSTRAGRLRAMFNVEHSPATDDHAAHWVLRKGVPDGGHAKRSGKGYPGPRSTGKAASDSTHRCRGCSPTTSLRRRASDSSCRLG
jgi:hypothetical protein